MKKHLKLLPIVFILVLFMNINPVFSWNVIDDYSYSELNSMFDKTITTYSPYKIGVKDGVKKLVYKKIISKPIEYDEIYFDMFDCFLVKDDKVSVYHEGKFVSSFKAPYKKLKPVKLGEINDKPRFLIYKVDDKYSWYDLKKHKDSGKFYEEVSVFSYSGRLKINKKDCLVYKEKGQWHNTDKAFEALYTIMEPIDVAYSLAIFPIELAIAIHELIIWLHE